MSKSSEDTETLAHFFEEHQEVLETLLSIHNKPDAEKRDEAITIVTESAKSCHAAGVLKDHEATGALATVLLEMSMLAGKAHEAHKDAGAESVQKVHEELVATRREKVPESPEHDKHHHEAWEDDHGDRYAEHADATFIPVKAADDKTPLLRVKKTVNALGLKAKDHLIVAVVMSLAAFIGCIYAAVLGTLNPAMVMFMGVWVLLSRGCAMSLVFLTGLMLLLMCRGFLTQVRESRIGSWGPLAAVLDRHTVLHRACGYGLAFFSALHILGHAFGCIPAIIESKSLDEINSALTGQGKLIMNPMSLKELAVLRPAWTGVVLVILLCGFSLASRPAYMKAHFKYFALSHELLIPLWLVFLIAHGSRQWLGIGVPLAVPVCGIPAIIYYTERLLRICSPSHTVSKAIAKPKQVYLEVAEPVDFKLGQYARIQIPELGFVWHPFTICSSPLHGRVSFMIAAVGPWTQGLRDCIKDGNIPKQIYVQGGFGAPADSMVKSRNLVMIGAGVGITPFLAAIQNFVLTHRELEGGLNRMNRAKFIWTTRDVDDFLWVADYAEYIRTHGLQGKFDVQLVLTGTKDSAQGTLFWQTAKVALDRAGAEKDALQRALCIPTKFGRPDFRKELSSFRSSLENKNEDVDVYVCGNPMLTQSISDACVAENKAAKDGSSFVLHAEEF